MLSLRQLLEQFTSAAVSQLPLETISQVERARCGSIALEGFLCVGSVEYHGRVSGSAWNFSHDTSEISKTPGWFWAYSAA
ncbi:hypothetical protein HPB50_008135 [Hyalomma asiaticum]|uniref:Uncharacterized protein n=1 Tax=Hyalomma asiaticum TaxID=266040 RepID=A0ACB7SPI7_HYAAI|nr:hypothetical protein HPB50_008135 [Hyalomma asiaticum]